MKRNEIISEFKKGVKAVKYNKKPNNPTHDHAKAKEKLAPQKPLEEAEVDESGLQYYTGVKKHGKPYMTAAAKLMRDGGNQKELGALKDRLSKAHKNKSEQGVAEGSRDRRDAYQRDYDSSVSGMGKRDSYAYSQDGGGNDERHDLDPSDWYIVRDGKMYKTSVYPRNEREAIRRGYSRTRDEANAKAKSTDEAMGAEVGKITKVDPATKKATLTKPDGSSMEVDSTALKPTPDGKMSMDTPDATELKTGTAVVSTEDMMAPTSDSSSPISGDEENVYLRRLRELAGQPAAPEDDGEYDAIDSVDSFNAFAQKQGAAAGLNPEQTAELQKMVVAEPDGSIDMEATMVNAVKGLADMVVQLLELFTTWLGMLEKAKADPAQWSALTSEEQKSIDDAINEMKAMLPGLQADAKKMPGLQAELDQVVAANKASGKTMRIPAKTPAPAAPPVEEADLTAMLRIAGLR